MSDKRGPRLVNDPDKYIRIVKGGKFQARPYDEGVRYDLGTFATFDEARRAIREFWWGRLKPLPKFVRCFHTRAGTRYRGVVPTVTKAGGRQWITLGDFDTREECAAFVTTVLRRVYGIAAAEAMLSRDDVPKQIRESLKAEPPEEFDEFAGLETDTEALEDEP